MREENVTKFILKWLQNQNWQIVCFDFPQSGTGLMLHPNHKKYEKNKGGIIPDIIAVKDSIAIFFENKDRFVKSDFEKIVDVKLSGDYSLSLDKLLNKHNVTNIHYGIGIPSISKEVNKSKEHIADIDFLLSVDTNGHISIHHDINGLFPNT